MSDAKKPVQGGVRLKLPEGVKWDSLAAMSPQEVRERSLLPAGFMPLPHVKQATGGQVFPDRQIDEVRRQEDRDLRRWFLSWTLSGSNLKRLPFAMNSNGNDIPLPWPPWR